MKSLRLLGVFFLFFAVSFAVNAYENGSGLRDAKGDLSLAKNGSMTFDKESYVFKGKAIKPKVIVYYDGKKIKKGNDYKLTFSNNDDIGYGKVTAEGKGKYTGKLSMEFPIVPQPVKIKKIKKNDSGFDASWKVAKDADGYEIAYGTESDFSDAFTEEIEGNKNNTVKVYSLKPNTIYHIRLRSYKTVSKKRLCSDWSKAQKFFVTSYPGYIENGTYMIIDLSGGTNAVRYPITYMNDVPPGGWSEEYKTTKLVLKLLPAGTFVMGSPEDEIGRNKKREQLHYVTLTRPFYMSIFEVTQKQCSLVINPSGVSFTYPMQPVNSISSNTSWIRGFNFYGWPTNNYIPRNSFFGILRAKTGQSFDLPTEAQWEYACRAGTSGAWNNGTTITNYYTDGNLAKLGRYRGNRQDGKGGYSGGFTTVGSYLPNAWGLYDMHGNAWEICLGRYSNVREYKEAEIDPLGPKTGHILIKGGNQQLKARECRSAFSEAHTSQRCGIRVILMK